MMSFPCQSGIVAFAAGIDRMAVDGFGIDTGEQMATLDKYLIFQV